MSGLEYVREKYGTLPGAALIAPAIELAERGFVLEHGDVTLLQEASEDLRKDAASAAIFLRRGEALNTGDTLVQKDLAATLRQVGDKGTRRVLQGTGRGCLGRIESRRQGHHHARRPRELSDTRAASHRVGLSRVPRGFRAAAELGRHRDLRGAERSRGLSISSSWGFGSAQAVHYEIEAMRHAYVDRNNLLGDPSFVRIRSSACSTRNTERPSAPRSTRTTLAIRRDCVLASRRTKACTRRTIRSWIAMAMQSA